MQKSSRNWFHRSNNQVDDVPFFDPFEIWKLQFYRNAIKVPGWVGYSQKQLNQPFLGLVIFCLGEEMDEHHRTTSSPFEF